MLLFSCHLLRDESFLYNKIGKKGDGEVGGCILNRVSRFRESRKKSNWNAVNVMVRAAADCG